MNENRIFYYYKYACLYFTQIYKVEGNKPRSNSSKLSIINDEENILSLCKVLYKLLLPC